MLQGELLRQIERLRYEAQHNENRNWNDDLLYYCDFLRSTLREADCLTPEEREEVNAALVRLRSSGEVACRYYQGDISDEELAEDYNGELAYQDDDLYDLVCDAIALFYRANPNPIPYERGGAAAGNPQQRSVTVEALFIPTLSFWETATAGTAAWARPGFHPAP